MAGIVNLNHVRKARAKAEAAAQAAANRVKHGRDKAAKANGRAEQDRRAKLLDNARREEPER